MVGDYKDPEWQGIIPRGFDHVITAIQTSENRKYVVRASFIEIYNE
jgi:kinesin family protein 3/17